MVDITIVNGDYNGLYINQLISGGAHPVPLLVFKEVQKKVVNSSLKEGFVDFTINNNACDQNKQGF